MKKGYTLVELLGVLVILALIISLVMPSIINFFKNSSEEVDKETIGLINNASDLFISNHTDDFPKINGSKFTISFTDLETSNLLPSSLKTSNGKENLSETKCVQVTYLDGEYSYELKNNGECIFDVKCILKDNDNDGVASLSDEVTCGTESFYVMENDGTNIQMLSKKNINVTGSGDIKQIDNAGTIAFSTTNYWSEFENKTYPMSVYGDYKDENGEQQNLIYPYVEAYEIYLKEEMRVRNVDAKLLSRDEAISVGCNEDIGVCGPSISDTGVLQYNSNPSPEWLYSTRYWLDSAASDNGIFFIASLSAAGNFGSTNYDGTSFMFGIRPLITISTDSIETQKETLPTICKYTDNDSSKGISRGDLVTCKTEKFYVISINSENNKLEMITEKNINITGSGDVKQMDDAGTTIFADTSYWTSATYVYNQNSKIYDHVEGYISYLNGKGLKNISGKLLSFDQAIELGCNTTDAICNNSWLTNTSFWLGTAYDTENIWLIAESIIFIYTNKDNEDADAGVRPVITSTLTEK